MKKIFCFLLLALTVLLLVLSSCGTVSEAGEPNPFSGRFAEYKASSVSTVVVDKLTGVCYIYRKAGYGGGMTVLLDTDGTPLLYEEVWYQAFGEAVNAE